MYTCRNVCVGATFYLQPCVASTTTPSFASLARCAFLLRLCRTAIARAPRVESNALQAGCLPLHGAVQDRGCGGLPGPHGVPGPQPQPQRPIPGEAHVDRMNGLQPPDADSWDMALQQDELGLHGASTHLHAEVSAIKHARRYLQSADLSASTLYVSRQAQMLLLQLRAAPESGTPPSWKRAGSSTRGLGGGRRSSRGLHGPAGDA